MSLAGTMSEYFGFPWTLTIFAGMTLLMCLATLGVKISELATRSETSN